MLLAALCTAILVWWILKYLGFTSRAQIAKVGRLAGGGLALAAAALLALRGRMDMAILLGTGGGWLLGWNALPPPFGGGGAAAARSAGTSSRVRSLRIDMELDHDSGRIGGTVLSGSFAGRSLDSLSDSELLRLHHECLGGDPDGARLLEAYLDRRLPGWREHAEARADERGRAQTQLSAMTQEEAYQVLGLEPGAGEAAVRDAHRTLMKKLHPDQGGSTYLASRVNQAKDVLLNRHR
jgi:hypothetical protein